MTDCVQDFMFETDEDDVHVFDGEGSLRVSIPLDIWLEIVLEHFNRYMVAK